MSVGGFFYSHNRYDHSASDDPIVHFAEPGTSHLHDFAGRVGVTAYSRPADLLDAPSTGVESNGGTYWVPALYINGFHITPVDFSARYGLGPTSNPDKLVAFPPDFAMVAGRTEQTVSWNVDRPRRPNVASWDTVPHPVDREELICKITFPDLWDGIRADGPDWTARTAYSKGKVIPDGWYAIPQLQLKIHYGKHLPPIETAELASGAPNTMHADFFNTWNQERLEAAVEHCLRGRRNCGEIGRHRGLVG